MKRSITSLYILLVITCLPSIYYWLDSLNWDLSKVGLLNIFPLFGLLAFSIMWLHLMVAWYKRYNPESYDYHQFFRKTSNLVLVLIILHPAILIFESLSIGIKPIDYAGENGRAFILFGGLALSIFILYEVVDRLRTKPIIKNNWPVIVGLNRAAMILIFFHALKLGTHLQNGPFKVLWWSFGLSLFAYFISAYSVELKNKAAKH